MTMYRKLCLILLLAVTLGLAGCGDGGPKKSTRSAPTERMAGQPTARS
jgi:hypothetical protein